MVRDEYTPNDPIAEWNLTPQVVDDLGDIHRRITECRTSFSMLKSVNRPVKKSDLYNISEMFGLVEQIADMTFMYLSLKSREAFYNKLTQLSNQLYNYFNKKEGNIPGSFFKEVTILMRAFYNNCMESGLWIKTGRRGFGDQGKFFTD